MTFAQQSFREDLARCLAFVLAVRLRDHAQRFIGFLRKAHLDWLEIEGHDDALSLCGLGVVRSRRRSAFLVARMAYGLDVERLGIIAVIVFRRRISAVGTRESLGAGQPSVLDGLSHEARGTLQLAVPESVYRYVARIAPTSIPGKGDAAVRARAHHGIGDHLARQPVLRPKYPTSGRAAAVWSPP